ncbi:MAG TPA: HDOD domain-containing protein [Polyangiaceae bacterium]
MSSSPGATINRPPPLPAAQRKLAESIREDLWFGDEDPQRTMEEASRSLAAAAAMAAGLKPFPIVAQRVMTLLADADTPVIKVRKAIEQDPALAARLLRVANSALYAPTVACRSVDDAVMRLGSRTVSEIVASLATLGLFADAKQGFGALFRSHCVGVAAVARVLGSEWRHKGVEHVFLSGLMHDIGKLLAMQVAEIRYEALEPTAITTPDQIHVHERAFAGYDHAVLGAHVLERWKLPHEISAVVALHHQPGRAFAIGGNIGLGVALLRLADDIEFQIRRERALDEAYVETLIRDGAAEYTQFSRDVLRAMWPKFIVAYDEAQRISS